MKTQWEVFAKDVRTRVEEMLLSFDDLRQLKSVQNKGARDLEQSILDDFERSLTSIQTNYEVAEEQEDKL